MRYATLAAALLAAGPALAGGICDPRYKIECVPTKGYVAPQVGYQHAYVAIPRSSHRPVVTGDPFMGGVYVKDVPAYPLAVQAPHALRPVPYVWGYVTEPGVLPQDPPPEYVRVRVPVQRHHRPVVHVPVYPAIK